MRVCVCSKTKYYGSKSGPSSIFLTIRCACSESKLVHTTAVGVLEFVGVGTAAGVLEFVGVGTAAGVLEFIGVGTCNGPGVVQRKDRQKKEFHDQSDYR